MTSAFPKDWKLELLDDVARRGSGHTPNRKVASYWNGGVKWVSLADSNKLDRVMICDSEHEISEDGIANSSAVLHPAGSVLVSRDAGVGKSAVMGSQMAVSQHFITWTCGPKLHNFYLYYWLQRAKPIFERMAVGSTIKTIGLSFFEKLEIPVPPLCEQKAIAEVLLCWDTSIHKREALVAAEVERKRGLMQRLLTGQIRFDGFKEKWKNCRLGDVVEAISRPVDWNEDELYHLASVRRNSGGVFAREQLYGHQIKVKKLQTICAGDFLVSHIQAAYGAMTLVPKEFDGAKVSDLYSVLRPKDPKAFDIRFLGYLGQTKRMWYMAIQASNGFFAERLRLNFDPDEFLHLPVNIPPTLAEQKKIADVLQTCDREIELLQKLLEALKEQKRGLMQKLLTGEVRVKV